MRKIIQLQFLWLFLILVGTRVHAQNDSLISGQGDYKVMISPELMLEHYFLESEDGGATWDTVAFNIEGHQRRDFAFLLDFNGPSPIRMLTNSHWVIPGFDGTFEYKGEVLVSNNRGRNWKKAEMPEFIKSIHRKNLHFSSPQKGIVFDHHHYAITQDSGYTWQLRNYPIKITYHRNKFIWFNDTLGTFSANYETIYTKDGGQSWLETVPSENHQQLAADDAALALGFFNERILLNRNYALILVHSVYQKHFGKKNQLELHEPQDEIDLIHQQKRLTPVRLKHGNGTIKIKENNEVLLTQALKLEPGKVYVLVIDRDEEGNLKATQNKEVANFCESLLGPYREENHTP